MGCAVARNAVSNSGRQPGGYWRDSAMSSFIFPKRTVHLDFHTGPAVPDVGADFDPEEFARTFAEANVDSVTVFAKCHHGHLYFNTSHPARHPTLPPGLDLLAEQIQALHRRGVRAPIYLSVQCDEYAANAHPEWIALTPELKHVKRAAGPFDAGWQILDMSSPYQDYLADQLNEVLKRFAPTDGIFLDMCWDQVSCSKWAIDGMKKASLDPADPEDRKKYARQVVHQYMARFRDMVEAAHRGHPPAGVWFNSRPKTNLAEEKQFLRHVEIEALPTGGWGYAYFPYVSRFVRPLNLPTLSHTGRFFRSWGDNGGLKPAMALKYECCQILSQGMTNGVGDLLPPRGKPNPAVYKLIGEVYAHIRACEPFVEQGRLLADIAVIIDPQLGDNPGPAGLGMVRMLQQLQQQFDLLPPSSDFSNYRVVVVPENVPMNEALRERLQAYLDKGGNAILVGASGFNPEERPWLGHQCLEGLKGDPEPHLFLHPDSCVADGLSDFAHVMYEPMRSLVPASAAKVLVRIGRPYFQRAYDKFSGHEYTPEAPFDAASAGAAVVEGDRVVTFAAPIFTAYGRNPTPWYRRLFGNVLRRLLPDPLIIADGHSRLETTVVEAPGRRVVHLLSFNCERRADGMDIVEDAIPLIEMPLAVRSQQSPSRVTLQPDNQPLPFEYRNGYAHLAVTMTGGHAMVVLED